MNTKIKIREIISPDFVWAMSQIINASIPAKAGYWLAKAFRKIEQQQKLYEEARTKALKKYCKVINTPDGKEIIESNPKTNEAIFVNEADKEVFRKEIEELLDQEVEVPQVPFNLLGDDTKIETRILLLLDKIIVENPVGQ